jgi:hypothetical protein
MLQLKIATLCAGFLSKRVVLMLKAKSNILQNQGHITIEVKELLDPTL